MSEYKEFQGKSLDAAIAEACAYYDSPREKLEIEIVQDAKSGIFGLVGARKALVRARRAQLPESGAKGKAKTGRKARSDAAPENTLPAADSAQSKQAEDSLAEKAAAGDAGAEAVAEKPISAAQARSGEEAAEPGTASGQGKAQTRGREKGRGRNVRQSPSASTGKADRPEKGHAPQARPHAAQTDPDDAHQLSGPDTDVDAQDLSLPRTPLSALDQKLLLDTSLDVVRTLVGSIVDDTPVEITIGEDRVMASINGDDTGLLIGREGQNLAAVQYLAARIISRLMNAQIRVQVDAGDYHSRQDSRLKDMARGLADKVRISGKAMSTKPLSAYQRRVIHLTLQDDPEIYTRSSGDGALKRVVVMRRKEGGAGQQD